MEQVIQIVFELISTCLTLVLIDLIHDSSVHHHL